MTRIRPPPFLVGVSLDPAPFTDPYLVDFCNERVEVSVSVSVVTVILVTRKVLYLDGLRYMRRFVLTRLISPV